MGGAARVHEQPEEPLGLRPALNRVLLVDLARVLRHPPDPVVGLVPATDAALGERLQHDLDAVAALVRAVQLPMISMPRSRRLGIAPGGDLLERSQPQLLVAGCRCRAVTRKRGEARRRDRSAASRLARRQPLGATRAPAKAAQTCCSP